MDLLPDRPLLVLAMLAGCYSPHDAVSTGGGDESGSDTTDAMTSGPSTGAMTTASTTAPTSTSSPEGSATDVSTSADDTAGDAPPELTSFSVNGSETPSEILEADLVEIQVAAMDDVGIARVEFYDGDTLIAEFTEPPYHTEFLVTSTENGGHSYTAVAYDTAEQTAEAGPIPLSVTIEGGAVLELQDAGFEATATLGVFGPHLAAASNRIYVAGSTRSEVSGVTRFRLAVSRMSLGLSNSGTTLYPSVVNAGTSHHEYAGHGIIDDDDNLLVPVSVRPNGGNGVVHVFQVGSDSGSVTNALTLGASSENALGGLGRTPDGAIAVGVGSAEIALYSSLDVAASWVTDVSAGLDDSLGVTRVASDSDGAIIIGGITDTGAFARKLSPDGDILWTRTVEDTWESGAFGIAFPAVDQFGSVSVVLSVSEADGLGLRLLTYDVDGNPTTDVVLEPGQPLFPTDIAYEVTGRVVISAINDLDSGTQAWLGRFSSDGTEAWSGSVDVDSTDALASAIVALPDGRLFATGLRDTVPEFLSTTGDTWVAEIAL